MAVASCNIKPSHSKHTNWIEACLAVQITKEGIEPFVYNEMKQFQQQCLVDICKDNGLPPGTICSNCCTENVVGCPSNRICNAGRRNCSYHKSVTKTYLPTGCPNQICHNLRNKINNAHRYYGPSYKNTDATQWCTNPWEVAKCFMPLDGYKDVTSPAETDFNGIINVFLNYKDFQAKISDNLSKRGNIFEKGRNIGNRVRHSPTLEVEDADLQQYFTDLQNLLSDPKLLAGNKDVQLASTKLAQLQNENDTHVDNCRQMLEKFANAIEEDITKQKLKLVKTMLDAVEKIEATEKATLSKIDYALKSAISDIERDIDVSITKLAVEADTNVRQTYPQSRVAALKMKDESNVAVEKIVDERKTGTQRIQEDVKESIKKLKTEDDTSVKQITSLPDKLEATTRLKQMETLTETSIQRMDCAFTTNIELAEDAKYKKLKKDEWDHCLDTEDKALLTYLILTDLLPDRKQLDRACLVFSRSSTIIGLITKKICHSLKQKYADKVKRVWAAYEPCMDNHIVFVIITKEEEDNASIAFKPDYDLRFRRECDFNSESLEVILEENDQDLFPEECEMLKVQTCIKETTSTLMNKHSNLTLISASILKCKGYGTDMCTTERKPCIVLHVHVKGLIPLRESVFPRHLGDIDTDVREGCVLLHCGKGPNEKHPNVKMGCGIKAKNQDACGTLGGFIDHPEYGLCALTCAHAMIDDIELSEILRKEFKNEPVECVQPSFEINNPEGSMFGILKLIAMRKGTSKGIAGFDYALIAVEKDRIPLDGSFPFVDKEELTNAGFHDPPSFATGETIDFKKLIGKRTRCSVVKYGSTTVLTCGMLKWLDPTVSFKDQSSKITLLNQIQVNLTRTEGKKCFSAMGDSGALVFKVDDSNKLTAVGLLVAGNAKLGFSVVTPICDILEDIKIQKLKPFNDPVETNNN